MESKFKILLEAIYIDLYAKCVYLWRRVCNSAAYEKKFVDELKWIEESEIFDLVAIA